MGTGRDGARRIAIPDLTLERYRLGELPSGAMHRVQAALATDPEVRARLASLEEADAAAREAYQPTDLARDIRRRAERTPMGPAATRHLLWLVPAAVATAVALVAVRNAAWMPAGGPSTAIESGDEERIKGDEAVLFVYRNTGAGGEPLADGDRARTGDVLRVAYRVSQPAFGMIVSVDGRGVVTRHLPEQGEHAVALGTGGTVFLNDAFELDDAPAVERFYFVCARQPFAIGPVAETVRASTAISGARPATQLPAHLTVTTLTLWKDPLP
jgi:anti-sigma factor RsiW